jgi:hypothetical protein
LVRTWSAIDQPTIIREYTSCIAQQCTVPSLAVFGDVGDPQRVRTVGDEPTLHQVIVDNRLRFLNTRGAL